jgi:hypothetical protein
VRRSARSTKVERVLRARFRGLRILLHANFGSRTIIPASTTDIGLKEHAMGTKDPRIDRYIEKSADFAKPILSHIRELIHATCPDLHETMKWGFPHFMYKGILCSMAAFKHHCAFGFWKGALVFESVPGVRKKHEEKQEGTGHI